MCYSERAFCGVVYMPTLSPLSIGHTTSAGTDHSALKWFMSFKDPQGQVAMWIEILGTYDIDTRHRPGAKHCNADSLSRH